MYVRTDERMYVCMHACMHVCIKGMYVCMYVLRVCMYVCMYVFVSQASGKIHITGIVFSINVLMH